LSKYLFTVRNMYRDLINFFQGTLFWCRVVKISIKLSIIKLFSDLYLDLWDLRPVVPPFGKFYLWGKSGHSRMWLDNLAIYSTGKIYQKMKPVLKEIIKRLKGWSHISLHSRLHTPFTSAPVSSRMSSILGSFSAAKKKFFQNFSEKEFLHLKMNSKLNTYDWILLNFLSVLSGGLFFLAELSHLFSSFFLFSSGGK